VRQLISKQLCHLSSTPVVNVCFEPILQCVSKYTATRLVYFWHLIRWSAGKAVYSIVWCSVHCLWCGKRLHLLLTTATTTTSTTCFFCRLPILAAHHFITSVLYLNPSQLSSRLRLLSFQILRISTHAGWVFCVYRFVRVSLPSFSLLFSVRFLFFYSKYFFCDICGNYHVNFQCSSFVFFLLYLPTINLAVCFSSLVFMVEWEVLTCYS